MAGTVARAHCVRHKGIAESCNSQLLGITVAYRVLETRRFADDLLLGYLGVDFTFTDRPPLDVELAALVKRAEDDWSDRPPAGVQPPAGCRCARATRSPVVRAVASSGPWPHVGQGPYELRGRVSSETVVGDRTS